MSENQSKRMKGTKMEQPKFAEEHKKMQSEPLLPIEKKLVAWSIGTGLVLLVILVWFTRHH